MWGHYNGSSGTGAGQGAYLWADDSNGTRLILGGSSTWQARTGRVTHPVLSFVAEVADQCGVGNMLDSLSGLVGVDWSGGGG